MEELQRKTKEEVEKYIKELVSKGVSNDNLMSLYKAIDIHKDIANEEYWKVKEEDIKMRYSNYGRRSYNDGMSGQYVSGNYGEGSYGREDYGDGSYGRRRRDSRGRYMDHGEEMLNAAYQNYQAYSDNRGNYEFGVYGAKEDTIKSLKYMLESLVCFFDMLKENASSKEEMELVKKYAKEISEM